MTGTNLQRKRSEHGASLILLVAIIGLAFIVTIGAFLLAASNAQNTARLASAKIDVANREDVLMREILRETATGMLNTTPESWTTIMTNATTINRLVSDYIDPNELTALGITGLANTNSAGITASAGDTDGNPLDIFQGYTGAPHNADFLWLGSVQVAASEVPFGGTSGLAGFVPNLAVDHNNKVIDPPVMNWSGDPTLSSATATITPQEFFLGSVYTGITTDPTDPNPVKKLSQSNRWGQIKYPAIRFGYKQPTYDASGNSVPGFIARRLWWRIPLVYNTNQQTPEDQAGVYRYPSMPANYVLSVYEIPSQLPISGNANLQIGLNDDGTAWGSGIAIAGPPGSTPGSGSIYGGKIQLYGGTYNGVSAGYSGVDAGQPPVNPVNVVNSTTVGPNGGVVYSDNGFDNQAPLNPAGPQGNPDPTGGNPGEQEKMIFQNPAAFPPGVAAPVSVAGNDGKVLLVPVMPGNDFYMQAPGNAPTHWDLYARPYYRCRIRVIISDTTPTIISTPNPVPNSTPIINPAAGAIKVTIYALPDTANPPQPDQILGFPDGSAVDSFWQNSVDPNGNPTGTFATKAPSYGMTYTSTPTGDRNILIINIPQLVQALGGNPAQFYSIYIGNPPNPPDSSSPPYNYPGIAIMNIHDLTTAAFPPKYNNQPFLFSSGLSIVSNQTLYLLDAFNQVIPVGATTPPPTSIYAPQIRYGISGINNLQVKLTGQVAAVAKPAPSPNPAVNPLSFKSSNNPNSIPSSNITATLNEVIDPTPWSTTSPTGLPPITALSLLFTIEKEHAN